MMPVSIFTQPLKDKSYSQWIKIVDPSGGQQTYIPLSNWQMSANDDAFTNLSKG
jgi:hypothetical protein